MMIPTFWKRIDAVLRRVLAEAERPRLMLILLLLLMMMMMVMILRRGRRFPDAAHQCQGTANPSAAAAPSSSTSTSTATPASTSAAGGGARRHPAALKHPEEPCRHVRLCNTLIPRREKRVLRPFPAFPSVHLSHPCLVTIFSFLFFSFLVRCLVVSFFHAIPATTESRERGETRACRENFGGYRSRAS